MYFSDVILVLSLILTLVFYFKYIKPSLGLSSTLLGLMLLLHGPAYLYYTHQWGQGEGLLYQYRTGINMLAQDVSTNPSVRSSTFKSSNKFQSKIKDALKRDSFQDNGISFLPTTPVEKLNIALSLTYLALCLGMWGADRAFKITPSIYENKQYFWEVKSKERFRIAESKQLLVFSGLAVVYMLYYLIRDDQIGKVLIYFFSRAGEFEKIGMRREMGAGSSYSFNLILGTLLTFFGFYMWAWWRNGVTRHLAWLILVVILLVIIAKAATLSKAPVAIFILQLAILEIARRSLRLSLKAVTIIAILFIALFTFMTFVANSNMSGLIRTALFLFYRIFMIPNESLLEYFLVFPNQIEFTYGQDIQSIAILMGLEPVSPNYWRVAEVMRGVGGSTTTAMFLADAWAAFSWAGVILTSLFFGFLVRWLDIELIVKLGRSPLTIAGLGLGYYGIWTGVSTAFQTALLTGGLALVLSMVLAIRMLEALGGKRFLTFFLEKSKK